MAVSSPLTLLSAAAVLVAGAAFLVTDRAAERPAAAAVSSPAARAARPAPSGDGPAGARPTERATKRPLPAVRRGETYVEVFNNSGVGGLAGSTADRAAGAGWQVVGSDNWYGTIDGSTVYYPRGLRRAARLLADDLGISRTKPVFAPMRGDRLTVILTADYL